MTLGERMAAVLERVRGLGGRLGNAARGRGGLDDKLALIGALGGVLFIALVGVLITVQHELGGVQDRLVRDALPAEQHLGQLEASIGAVFDRQAQVASTVATEQLAPLRDRAGVEGPLREAAAALGLRPEATQIPADVEAVLAADAELFDAVERRHRWQREVETELGRIDADLRTIVEDSQAIAGLLRLEYVQVLRGIAASLDSGVRTDLVRTAVLGDVRAALDDTEALAMAVLGLARVTGQLGLAASSDAINSLAANELPQIRSRIAHLIASLDTRLGNRPDVATRAAALERRFDDIAPRIIDDTRPDSLVALRRKVVSEAEAMVATRAASVAAASKLTAATAALHAAIASEAAASVRASSAAAGMARLLTIAIIAIGLAGCVFAGRRIASGITELQRTNHRLTEMKLKLESFNASLEYKVASGAEALVARDRVIQRVLDSVDEGLATVSLDGGLRGERSRMFVTWFGDPGDRPLWEVLFPGDLERAAAFARGFERLVDAGLPFETAASQLPSQLERDGRLFRVELRPIHEHGKLSAVQAVVHDETAAIAARRAEVTAREDRTLLAALVDQVQRRVSYEDMMATVAESPRARGTGVPKNQTSTMRISSFPSDGLLPPARRQR